MSEPIRLDSLQLRLISDPEQFAFQSTAELEAGSGAFGQVRALNAIQFGLRIKNGGFNIFALGHTGVGKQTTLQQVAEQEATAQPVPPDWCYLHNFEQTHRPRALCLPPGRGAKLRRDMAQLVEDLGASIPAAFESEDYRSRVEELEEELKERQSEAIETLGEQAKSKNIGLLHTPNGFAFAPLSANGEVLRPEHFRQLPENEQEQIEQTIESLQQELQKLIRQFPLWAKETREKIKALNREIAALAVNHLIEALHQQYADLPEVQSYIDATRQDVIDNVDAFLEQAEGHPQFGMPGQQSKARLRRYEVNLIVDNSRLDSAPVVQEDLPSFGNLLGRVEYQAQMGTLVTDFSLIKAGALHRANGGYLLLDARQVLMHPFAWDGLKRTLQSGEIRLDSLERSLSLFSTVSLEPEPIPVDVKVLLMGDRRLYYLLSELDPDFQELFKVMSDFDDSIERTPESEQSYACLFAAITQEHSLRPLERAAVARLIEHGARMAGDSGKISTHLRGYTDLLSEADHWASQAGREQIARADLQKAIDQQIYRAERMRETTYRTIQEGVLLVDVEGAKTGQINGLSVLQLGQFAFGQPVRITATTRMGDGKVIDIERETELGGPIHSKGVLILSSFLAARYAGEQPLSMAASLVFEQSYGPVEGDSASLAELCVLLSSLAAAPICQSLALTGSVNQHGQVQPIGGVNEKIEGFFDVCRAAGLSGQQGVIIPSANTRHLMLREDVVQAAKADQFYIYSVTTVDEALTLLTGLPAGKQDIAGRFPSDSLNGKVANRLLELAELRRDFASSKNNGSSSHE